MKKKFALLLLPLLLCGLTSCDKLSNVGSCKIDKDYEAVHIYGIGCVSTSKCELVYVNREGSDGVADIWLKYTDKYGDEFTTTEFALVKGACPICKK